MMCEREYIASLLLLCKELVDYNCNDCGVFKGIHYI